MMSVFLRICASTLTVTIILSCSVSVFAGTVPEASSPKVLCEPTIEAWIREGWYRPGDCYCNAQGNPVCRGSSSEGYSPGKAHDYNHDIKMMVVGTVFESLLTSVFADNKASEKEAQAAKQKAAELARQQAEMTRAQQMAAQAAYEQMMKSYKQLDDYQNVGFKTLSDTDLGFKTLDSDAETLAANARQPFDTASSADASMPGIAGGATPFFGDSMPIEDIRFLVDPDSDPNLVDLQEAETFLVQSLKDETPKSDEPSPSEARESNHTHANSPACSGISQKLAGYIHQRQQFQKTVSLSLEQVDTWKKANRNALFNAAKDGIAAVTGHLLDVFTKRGLAADRLQGIYQKNAARMAQEGIDPATIEAKIKYLKMLSTRGQFSDMASNMDQWQSFIKDGMSSLVKQLTQSNQEIEALLDDPKLQKYFEHDTPELKALLDISKIAATNKVFGKWVARKLPIVASLELATNELYNGLDWYLSYKRLAEANQINGRVLAAVRSLQVNINETSLALENCNQQRE